MFAEVVDGLLSRTLLESASALSEPTPDTILNQPKCRIGIIPAGSIASSAQLFQLDSHLFSLWNFQFINSEI